jgi:hypothetical protein
LKFGPNRVLGHIRIILGAPAYKQHGCRLQVGQSHTRSILGVQNIPHCRFSGQVAHDQIFRDRSVERESERRRMFQPHFLRNYDSCAVRKGQWHFVAEGICRRVVKTARRYLAPLPRYRGPKVRPLATPSGRTGSGRGQVTSSVDGNPSIDGAVQAACRQGERCRRQAA